MTTPDPGADEINEDLPPAGLAGAVTPERGKTLHEQRFTLAAGLLALVSVTVAALLAAAVFAPVDHLDAVQSMSSVIFGPLITLLGTSFAWYYATRKSD